MKMQITKHAYEKAKQRLSWNKRTMNRMIPKVMESGVDATEYAQGEFKKYIENKVERYPSCDKIIVHGDVLFFISKDSVVTLYRTPSSLIKYTKYITNKSE